MNTSSSILTLLIISFWFISCKTAEKQHLADYESNYYRFDDKIIEKDNSMDEFLEPYRSLLEEKMDLVIGDLPIELTKSKPNSNLGNWFADMLLDEATAIFKDHKVDFAIQNYGGLRVNAFAKGPITKGDIFELMPFDNYLVLVELDADRVQSLMDRIAHYGGWPICRSLQFTIQDSAAVSVLINEIPIDEKKTYYAAMPDYVANGGDDCHFLKGANIIDSGIYIRDVIIQHIEKKTNKQESIIFDNNFRIKEM